MLDLTMAESIQLPEGTIYICESDSMHSVGFLRLNPNQKLAKHNRPVEEWLVQIEGASVVILYKDDKIDDEIRLKRGDSLRIPENQYHQHTNPENQECLTSWHFDGDITKVIEVLRSTS